MAIKNSLFSRLFRKKPEAVKAAEPAAAEVKEHPPVQQRPVEVQPKKPTRHWLELPQDHAIHKLCALYREQSGQRVRLELALEGPDDPCLPDQEASAELKRLMMTVTAASNKRLKLAQAQQKKEGEEQPVSPDLDAQAIVFLNKTNLTAWLMAYPPVGNGRHLNQEIIQQALEKQKVSFGVDRALLEALPQNAERYFQLFTVARGQPEVPGVDGRIIENFPRDQEHRPVADENDKVDYANLGLIHNVEKGGEICRIILPTNGTPGRTVQDREIPAKDGKSASVPRGQNTEISEDGQSLVAAMSGHVDFSGQCFHVKPVMDIPGNVDFSVGNINFLGDVCIRGDVCSGFSVKATGSITIDGVVEASTIEAGRDLIVVKGVQGDNQAVLRAEGKLIAKYLENCCIYAKQDLETECIINCEVYCDGIVTAHSGHGKIIGGKVHAGQKVNAGIVGSRIGNRTDIILGGQPCEDFDYALLTKEIRELEENLKKTERQPSSPGKSSQMAKLRAQLADDMARLEAIEQEREDQPQEAEEQPRGRYSMKCTTVHPGTVLSIADVVYHFDDMFSPCLARLVDGEIQLI